MSRYARRTDANHGPVCDRLVELGWLVKSVAALPEWVDVTAYRPSHGVVLFEIKDGPKKKLKPSQDALLKAGWPIVRLDSPEDAEHYTLPPTPKKVSDTY